MKYTKQKTNKNENLPKDLVRFFSSGLVVAWIFFGELCSFFWPSNAVVCTSNTPKEKVT